VIVRSIGFVALLLVIISWMAHQGMIEITAPPLKQLINALIGLANTLKNSVHFF